MEKFWKWGVLFLILVGTTSQVYAGDWRIEYMDALEAGKAVELPQGQTQAEGLAYTPPEEVVLEEAISRAMEKKAPACECMKIAVDLDYNPYSVLKNIYSAGGDLELDQLCICATEAGIMKAIIAKAAKKAVSPLGEPIFKRDEIAQSQCLGGEEGLPYTPSAKALKKITTSKDYGDREAASPSAFQ